MYHEWYTRHIAPIPTLDTAVPSEQESPASPASPPPMRERIGSTKSDALHVTLGHFIRQRRQRVTG